MSLLVVGSVAYDSVETASGKVEHALGGSATFFAMAASLMTPTQVVAVVGEDFRPSDLERMRRRGIDTNGIERVPGATFRWGGRYSEHFETRTSLFTELNVFEDFQPKVDAAGRGAEVVFLANIHPTLQLDVLRQVARPRFVALDTMGFWIAGEPAALSGVLRHVDALFVNDEEARQLAGTGNLVHAARRIQAMGPRTVVVKRGEHGATLFHDGRAMTMPAVMLDHVVDPTGCGDTFAGGFVGYLAATIDRHDGPLPAHAFESAMVMGTLLASFCCEDFSVDALERADLPAVLERHERLVQSAVRLELDHQHLHDAVRRRLSAATRATA
jgi:sugar/nucleoside kinase (ribokinase family)